MLLATALTTPASEFIVPVQCSEVYDTDTLCMEALNRMIVFYTVKGMYIKGEGLTTDGKIVKGSEHGGICRPIIKSDRYPARKGMDHDEPWKRSRRHHP